MTAPTRLICRPWVVVEDLPSSRPSLDDDTWLDLAWQASEQLYTWSGRQYSGGCASTVVLDASRGSAPPCWRYEADPWVSRGDRGIRAQVVALLPDSPVTSVDTVTIDGADLVAEVDYVAELPAGLVTRTGGLSQIVLGLGPFLLLERLACLQTPLPDQALATVGGLRIVGNVSLELDVHALDHGARTGDHGEARHQCVAFHFIGLPDLGR